MIKDIVDAQIVNEAFAGVARAPWYILRPMSRFIDAKVESLYEGQKVITQSVQDVNEKLRRLELLLTSKSSASSLASKLGMGTGRAAA